ncbi:hypothetical protein [Embleya sp. NBC_00896]|uniref:hypothetical protein n=1 Tax=Embleya sp. NBC_00896 TaxID=2975961 RepID=UPI0038631B4E|nr:hypothetical protein OG928_32610 [Embleya sp. NBC_00896]
MRARTHHIVAATSAAVLAVVALGACSSGDGKPDNTKTDAKALADKAVAYLWKHTSMEGTAKGTDEDGEAQEMKVCGNVTPDGDLVSLKGTLVLDGQDADVISIDGKDYIRIPLSHYIKMIGTNDPTIAARVEKSIGGKYIVSVSDDDETGSLFEGGTGGVTKGEVTQFDGKQAIPLTKIGKDGAKKTVYVAAKGDVVVYGNLEENGRKRIETIIVSVGKPCDVAAPPQGQFLTEDEFDKAFDESKTP